MIQRQPVQVSNAVEIPSSGSASLKEEKIAIMEIAVARTYGSAFFIIIGVIFG
jgi:hypothetical protein